MHLTFAIFFFKQNKGPVLESHMLKKRSKLLKEIWSKVRQYDATFLFHLEYAQEVAILWIGMFITILLTYCHMGTSLPRTCT